MAIQITNKKILSFFDQRPDMDIELTLIKFVDIMESLQESMSKTLTNTSVLEILDNLKIMNTKIERNQESTEVNLSKYMDVLKKDMNEEIKTIMSVSMMEKVEPTLREKLKEQQSQIVDVAMEKITNMRHYKWKSTNGRRYKSRTLRIDAINGTHGRHYDWRILRQSLFKQHLPKVLSLPCRVAGCHRSRQSNITTRPIVHNGLSLNCSRYRRHAVSRDLLGMCTERGIFEYAAWSKRVCWASPNGFFRGAHWRLKMFYFCVALELLYSMYYFFII